MKNAEKAIRHYLKKSIEIQEQRLKFDRQVKTLQALGQFNQVDILRFRLRLREFQESIEPVDGMPPIQEAEKIRRIVDPPDEQPGMPSLAELAAPVLGMLEDLAIAVQVGCLDEEILQRALALIICDVFEGMKPYIDYRRRVIRLGDPSSLYRESEWLYQRWRLPRSLDKTGDSEA